MTRPALTVTVLTAFPGFLERPFSEGILDRARRSGRIEVRAVDLRAFAHDRHRTLDDTPYGGGPGMLLMAPPVLEALACVGAGEGRPGLLRVLLAPDGERFEQASARRWATELDHLVVVSGRYEGIDDRIRTRVDRVVSLGDFVLMGGEAAAWAIAEAVLRLVPGVVEERSLAEESFEDGLLEAPQFTRPPRLGDGGSDPERSLSVHADPKADAREAVPEILRSGDHGRVARARRRAALARTLIDRPDLLRGFDPAPDDARRLGEVLETVGQRLQTLEEGIGPSGSGIRPGSGDDWAWRMLY